MQLIYSNADAMQPETVISTKPSNKECTVNSHILGSDLKFGINCIDCTPNSYGEKLNPSQKLLTHSYALNTVIFGP